MSAPNAQGSQQVIANNPESSRPVPAPRQDERASRPRRSEAAPRQSSQRASGQQRQSHAQNSTGLRITYLQNPQVENIKHDKTVGEGVQKTLAYDTPKTQSELQAWREEFWGKLLTCPIASNFRFSYFREKLTALKLEGIWQSAEQSDFDHLRLQSLLYWPCVYRQVSA